ncbi:MAG: hypothetical protein HQK79_05130 [Desulfobacterales bacterium]|nr:hypothetical protein [Desulfobacterales bacterium]
MKKTKTPEKEITITGYVTEIEEDDEIVGVRIITDDDDDYVVELNNVGKRLLDLIDEEIRANGIIKKEKGGVKKITISDFEVIEYEDDDDFDDDDYDEDDDEDYDDEDDDFDDEDDDEEEEPPKRKRK